MSQLKFTLTFLWFVMLLSASAQTNLVVATNGIATVGASPTNQMLSLVQRAEEIRAVCIQGRRSICGKIIQVLPEGLVVDSGYTNLLREPLTSSWLVPGTVVANRANNLVEEKAPGAICIGLVYLTDFPKSKRLIPKRYDYVIIEGYPAGQQTYTSVGAVHKTVRRFSALLAKAVDLNLSAEANTSQPAAATK